MNKIVVMEMSKNSKAIKAQPVARQGSVVHATSDNFYKVMVDGVQLTSKNATFTKKGGHLIVAVDGELVIDLNYGTALDKAPAELQVTDGWCSLGAGADFVAPEATEAGMDVAAAPAAGPGGGEHSTSPLLWSGLAVLGAGGIALAAGGGGGGDDAAAPAPTASASPPATAPVIVAPAPSSYTITGDATAGPVIAGNGLKVVAYDKDHHILGESSLDGDGKFTIIVTNGYKGVVLVRLLDANDGPDYRDEATGLNKDLAVELRAVTTVDGTGTISVHITPLTELAVRSLGLVGDTLGATSEAAIIAANTAVAKLFGLGDADLAKLAPEAIIHADGSANAGVNAYGKVLAMLSGVDAATGGSMELTLDTLIAGINQSGTTLTWNPARQIAIQEQLMAGAAQVADTTGHSVSDLVVAIGNTPLVPGDTVAPTADSIVVSGHYHTGEVKAGTLVAGDKIHITLAMSEGVVVDGHPTLAIGLDGQGRAATYVSGSGSKNLVFEYMIANGDSDMTGGVAVGGLTLHDGAHIVDVASNAISSTTLPTTTPNAVTIDAVAPSTTAAVTVITNDLGPLTGSLDTGFGTNGRVVFDVDSQHYECLAMDSQGRYVVAGESWKDHNLDFMLTRYTAGGHLDSSFGKDGKVITDFGNDDSAHDMVIDTQGRIVVVGLSSAGQYPGYTSACYAVARYNADGILDTSFGDHGKVITAVGHLYDEINSVAVDGHGRIVVAGTTFNGTDHDFMLMRYKADGSLDTGFGTNGKVITDFSGHDDLGERVAIDSQGQIMVTGEAGNGTNFDYGLVRYNTDGSLDTTFGTNGKVVTDFGGQDGGRDLKIDSQGGIEVVGGAANGHQSGIGLARYTAVGSLVSKQICTDTNSDHCGYEAVLDNQGQIAMLDGLKNHLAMYRYNPGHGGTTNDTSLAVSGSLSAALVADETVCVYDGATFLGTATVNGTTWTYSDPRTLTDHQAVSYTAQVADGFGNQSAAGTAYTVTVDIMTWADVVAMTPEQVATITPEQGASLMTPAQFAHLTGEQLHAIINMDNQLPFPHYFRPEMIAALPPVCLASLTVTELASMDIPGATTLTQAQLNGLTATQLNAIRFAVADLSLSDIAHINADDSPYWSPAQLAGFSPNQIAGLTTDAVHALTATQLAALESTDLTASQISSLTASQHAALGTAPLSVADLVQDHGANSAFANGIQRFVNESFLKESGDAIHAWSPMAANGNEATTADVPAGLFRVNSSCHVQVVDVHGDGGTADMLIQDSLIPSSAISEATMHDDFLLLYRPTDAGAFSQIVASGSSHDDVNHLLHFDHLNVGSQLKDGEYTIGLKINNWITDSSHFDQSATTTAVGIIGTSGNDVIKGGHGDDIISSGRGNALRDADGIHSGHDTLTGGAGADTFRWIPQDKNGIAKLVTITDFNPAEGDKLDLRDLLDGRPADSSLSDYIQMASSDSLMSIRVDPDGLGSGRNYLYIDLTGQAGMTDSLSQLVAQGVIQA